MKTIGKYDEWIEKLVADHPWEVICKQIVIYNCSTSGSSYRVFLIRCNAYGKNAIDNSPMYSNAEENSLTNEGKAESLTSRLLIFLKVSVLWDAYFII